MPLTQLIHGTDTQAPFRPYVVTIFAEGTAKPLDAAFDPNSSGTLMLFSDGGYLTGNYDLSNGIYNFFSSAGTILGLALDVYWTPTSTEVVRLNPPQPEVYQARPEDELHDTARYETADEYPFRRSVVGGGDLIEITGHAVPFVPDVAVDQVSQTVAVKDHTGVDYTVIGINSTVQPIRTRAEVNPTDVNYTLGQSAIAYKGSFQSLPNQTLTSADIIPGFFTDLSLYMQNGFALYHAGLVQGVLVVDPMSFFSVAHREGLDLWLPLNEHPDEGAVVNDRSVSQAQQMLSGFTLSGSFANRAWDNEVGWYLHMENNGSIAGSGIKQVNPNMALSMWVRPDDSLTYSDASTLYQQGPLTVNLDADGDEIGINFQNLDGSSQTVANVPFTHGEFVQVAVSVNGKYVSYGTATQNYPLSLTVGTLADGFQPFNGTNTDFFMNCPDRRISFSDVRVWNQAKTQAELEQIRNYRPVPTICTYWPTNISVAGSQDRYGLKAAGNGFVYPDKMPPAIRVNQLARVRRYTDEGRFEGENRYNETGFGGGMPLPPVYELGQQFFDLAATGTIVFSNSLPVTPGTTYNFYSYSGSTSNGFAGTAAVAGVNDPYEFTNLCQEFVWIAGQNGGVYEMSMMSTTGTQAIFTGTKVGRLRSDVELIATGHGTNSVFKLAEQPTGLHVNLANSGTVVVVQDDGTPVQIQTSVTGFAEYGGDPAFPANFTSNGPHGFATGDLVTITATPGFLAGVFAITVVSPTQFTYVVGGFAAGGDVNATATLVLSNPVNALYMYLNANTKENVQNAWNNWTDRVDPNLFGNKQTPPLAALNTNDILEFENTSTLETGRYRLTVVSGNIGQVDADFEGFNVQITIDTVQINGRLAAGATGANFTATDAFEFELNVPVNPNWLMTVQLFNATSDPTRGTARQMEILSYKLEKLQTSVYQITINNSGTHPVVTPLDVSVYSSSLPGGWLAEINSYGTVCRIVHESLIYPFNDTVSSPVPMSSLLSSNTWAKREDHFVQSGTNVIIADAVHPPLPVYTGIVTHTAGFLIDPGHNFIVDPIDGGRIIAP